MPPKTSPAPKTKTKASASLVTGLMLAASLISAASPADTLPELTPEAIDMLAALLKHNDAVSGNRVRVGEGRVREALREKFGVEVSPRKFQRLIRKHFQRSWSGL